MKSLRLIVVLGLVLALVSTGALAKKKKAEDEAPKDEGKFSAATFAGLKLRGIGPALMSGRIADIAVHPDDPATWYVAVGSGGVWKTENRGTTWTPIFDGEKSYSIGCVTIDPNRPETIWVGSGENVGGRHVGYGDGVYRSEDGGKSWQNVGLEKTEHIGSIVIDPRDSKTVFVAAQGPLWSPGGERGLYKTTDGGEEWEKILGEGEYVGVNEVLMHPEDPDVLFATTHQRFRNVAALINGGPGTAIHKSVDGGKSWRELTNGLPKEDMGRIGMAISPQKPDVVYATIELAHRKGGFYRSADGGESWEKRNDYISGGTGPHYYQEIFASPHQFDRVYQMDVRMNVTEDGGKTFNRVPSEAKHSDNHALAFDPHDPDYLLSGCDGGLYQSWDLGVSWSFIANLPVTQFYKVAVDYDEPFYNVVGGTQDNATQHGPSRTDNIHGIRNSDWMITVFGDGHQPAIDPTNPDIIYSEWQQGNLVRHDGKTGEIVYIQPQPAKGESSERFNWDSPILISPHDPKRIYFASQRVWRSDDRGDSWRPISGDLSRGRDRLQLPMMGRVWSWDAVWDLLAMSKYATVTSLAESPKVDGLFYAGTDDGLIQITEDGGESWRTVDSLPGVEGFFFVNDIKADLHDADTVYVAVDRHKDGDFAPYLFKSTDRGRSWQSIAGDLPERHLVWRLVQDHERPGLMFAGTEFGVFFTVDAGAKWVKLSGGVPTIPFRDLVIQRRENDLVGATFGRGFYILDDYSALRQVSEESLEQPAELFPVRKAWWYMPRRTLGARDRAFQGKGFYVAPNPPFGAVFTYYLADTYKSSKEERKETEKKIAEEEADTPFPGWEALRRERLEEEPNIVLTVRDGAGNVVRRLTGPAKKGIHRVSWDLRYPSIDPWRERRPRREVWEEDPDSGHLAAPGRYSVQLAKRVDGEWVDLGKGQTFDVVPLWDGGTLPGASPEQAVDFWRELAEAQATLRTAAQISRDAERRLKAIKETLMRSSADDPALGEEARSLLDRLAELRLLASGDPTRSREANDRGPVSIQRRLGVVSSGTGMSTYGPTPTLRESLSIATEQLDSLTRDLRRIVDVELPALETRLDAAGVPWTPGRGL